MYHLVTGRPPFEGDTPSAVMHKHLKAPLVPADHINTALSAGVAEIIEFAMAKDRGERYASTEDLVEDLRAALHGASPTHARRAVDLDSLEKIEETGKTIDLSPSRLPSVWVQPAMLAVLIGLGVSLLVNAILLIVYISR
jgi:hypothetical protein